MKLAGRVALVTGGARGIGRGIALALAAEGADVAIAEIDRAPGSANQYGATAIGGLAAAAETVRELGRLGRRALAIAADVTQAAQVERMVRETVAQLGGLDVLVCNAGVVHVAAVEHLDEAAFDLTMAVNVIIRACSSPAGRRCPSCASVPGACIINVASVAGKNGAPGMAHYCASKFAVVGFTNALAKEVASAGIRVNAICPGILRTQMWEYLAERLKEVCPDVVDRGARDPGGVSSRLSDRRPPSRGGKEAPSMLKVFGGEAVEDEVDGHSLLDEIAREGAAGCSWRRWRPRSLRTWRRIATNGTATVTPWSCATARPGLGS